MKLIAALLAATLAAHTALGAQPPEETTDVDEATTSEEAAPLDPELLDRAIAAAEVSPYVVYDSGLRPDGERTESDLSYESRVLGAFRVTQGVQGPLDGRWHVSGSDGVAIYTLQLTDPGGGEQRIEGAFRNLKSGGVGSSGFIDTVRRDGDAVIFSFKEGIRDTPVELRLREEPNGVWVGEAQSGGIAQGVIANRGQGLETAAMAVPEWRAPPPPRAKAKAKSKSKSKARPKAKSRNKRR